uniref:Uncharacterized protein n=1 Tax=Ditylenchus dipsaci TaxID=166011 RepID=A0A915D478_9BILA
MHENACLLFCAVVLLLFFYINNNGRHQTDRVPTPVNYENTGNPSTSNNSYESEGLELGATPSKLYSVSTEAAFKRTEATK